MGKPDARSTVPRPLDCRAGRVPASPARWAIAGGVSVIERDLERAVHQGCGWHVSLLLRPHPETSLAEIAAAQARFTGGCLDADDWMLCASMLPWLPISLGWRSPSVLVPRPKKPHCWQSRWRRDNRTVRLPSSAAGRSGTVIVGPWSGACSASIRASRPAPLQSASAELPFSLFKDKRAHGAYPFTFLGVLHLPAPGAPRVCGSGCGVRPCVVGPPMLWSPVVRTGSSSRTSETHRSVRAA